MPKTPSHPVLPVSGRDNLRAPDFNFQGGVPIAPRVPVVTPPTKK